MSEVFSCLSLLLIVVFTEGFLKLFLKCTTANHVFIDTPTQRSSHMRAKPRGAGIVFLLIWWIAGGVLVQHSDWDWNQTCIFFITPTLISLMGFLDDYRPLSIRIRLIVYSLTACITVNFLGAVYYIQMGFYTFYLGFLAPVLAVLALVWSTNIFNFMDGLDGVAAVEAIFILLVGGFFLWGHGGIVLAKVAWSLALAVCVFLKWNVPSARLMMGDTGSCFLGFVIGLLALLGRLWYKVPLFLWFILYMVFMFDGTLTLLRRIHNDYSSCLQPHLQHAFHRLYHKIGWSQKQIVLLFIGLNSYLGLIASWVYFHPNYLLVAVCLGLAVLGYLYYQLERRAPMIFK